jgi:hypothetical protein
MMTTDSLLPVEPSRESTAAGDQQNDNGAGQLMRQMLADTSMRDRELAAAVPVVSPLARIVRPSWAVVAWLGHILGRLGFGIASIFRKARPVRSRRPTLASPER